MFLHKYFHKVHKENLVMYLSILTTTTVYSTTRNVNGLHVSWECFQSKRGFFYSCISSLKLYVLYNLHVSGFTTPSKVRFCVLIKELCVASQGKNPSALNMLYVPCRRFPL